MRLGDCVLGYSDGVVEAQSPSGELFGIERLVDVVSSSSAPPSALIDEILAALERFTLGTEPYDDVTLVAIRRGPEATP